MLNFFSPDQPQADRPDWLKRVSDNYLAVLETAARLAFVDKRHGLRMEDLFVGILFNKSCLAAYLLNQVGINIKETLTNMSSITRLDLAKVTSDELASVGFDDSIEKLLIDSYQLAKELGSIYVGTEHLLLAMLDQSKQPFVMELQKNSVTPERIKELISRLSASPFAFLRQSGKDGSTVVGGEGALEYFGVDLVQLASQKQITNIIDRQEDVDQMIKTLIRREKHNPLIVGPSGVGKTSLVYGLAHRIALGEVPAALMNSRILLIKTSLLLSGGRMPGEVEKKFMAILKEAEMRPEVILFFDDIHSLFGTPLRGGMSLEEVIKPVLSQGIVRAIGTTTDEHFRTTIEGDAALMRRFKVIEIDEPSVEECIKILGGLKSQFESHHKVIIKDEAIELAVKLSDTYISDRYLPDKAIDLIDEACAAKRIGHDKKYEQLKSLHSKLDTVTTHKNEAVESNRFAEAKLLQKSELQLQKELSQLQKQKYSLQSLKQFAVDSQVIREMIAEWTGIPINTLTSGERSNLLHLDKEIARHIVSQNDAVEKVAYAVKRGRIGITDKSRPWASFLFLGPTGVGKTEMAKVLAKILFGNEGALVQIDMSEFMEMHSVSKLIGSPPGYVGFEQGGWLTEQIRKNPHSVILFDEIEKAHPDVLNILLQILEDGHLTDGRGTRVNFTNTIIIMTSNIGAEKISEDKVLGFTPRKESPKEASVNKAYEAMKNNLNRELKKTLRPELLNRLDDVVIFKGITKQDAAKIIELLIVELNTRLQDIAVIVDLDRKAKNFILKSGYSEEYGARPLRRTIQHHVEDVIADYVLANRKKATPTDEITQIHLTVGAKDGGLTIQSATTVPFVVEIERNA